MTMQEVATSTYDEGNFRCEQLALRHICATFFTVVPFWNLAKTRINTSTCAGDHQEQWPFVTPVRAFALFHLKEFFANLLLPLHRLICNQLGRN